MYINLTKLTEEHLKSLQGLFNSKDIEEEFERRKKEALYDVNKPQEYIADIYKAVKGLEPFYEGKRSNVIRKALEDCGAYITLKRLLLSFETLRETTGEACYKEVYGEVPLSSTPSTSDITESNKAEVIAKIQSIKGEE
jgi:hypothetical protein